MSYCVVGYAKLRKQLNAAKRKAKWLSESKRVELQLCMTEADHRIEQLANTNMELTAFLEDADQKLRHSRAVNEGLRWLSNENKRKTDEAYDALNTKLAESEAKNEQLIAELDLANKRDAILMAVINRDQSKNKRFCGAQREPDDEQSIGPSP